jgi:hypothetical protein
MRQRWHIAADPLRRDQSGLRSIGAAAQRLSSPRRDLVYLKRLACGRETLAAWTLQEVESTAVHQLPSAHLPRFAHYVCYKRLPHDLLTVLGAIPAFHPSPFERRRRLETSVQREALKAVLQPCIPSIAEMPDLWRRYQRWAEAPASVPDVQGTMLAKLTERGGVGLIRVDAYWEKHGAHRRTFAGVSERGFARGVVRIARLAQCPVVPFTAVADKRPRTVLVEWGELNPTAGIWTTGRENDVCSMPRSIGRRAPSLATRRNTNTCWEASDAGGPITNPG